MLWVILAVILMALAAAWIIMRRRYAAMRVRPAEPASVAPPGARPSEVEEKAEPAAAARPAAEERSAGLEAEPPAGREVEVAASTEEAEVEAEAATEVEVAPEAKVPAPSPRSQVETQLDESARLLEELRAAASGAEEGSPLNAESVEIMEEGLEEIRALAERKQWGQARDKGKALHAQLTLLLQSARREKSP